MNPSAGLSREIQRLAVTFPVEWLEKLAVVVETTDTTDWTYARAKILRAIAQPGFQHGVQEFLEAWEKAPDLTSPSVALALRAAVATHLHHAAQQSLDLVWTGPDSHIIPLRRTDEALLQLINAARQRLLIVSFAVYKAEAIASALARAAQRGVTLTLCLETPEASEGKITFDTLRSFGPAVLDHAAVYVWPLDQRLLSPDGRHGSLHAKVAVADSHLLFLSSANLTEYAMTLNMEMGVLIEGGEAPGQIERHFERLIEKGVLRRIESRPG